MKKYVEFLEEITKEELYEGLLGYGMFSEKLPPIFSSVKLYEHYKNRSLAHDCEKWCGYISFDSMRNTSIPRTLGIPNPIQYAILCRKLTDNFDDIIKIIERNTKDDKYKISRLHIRKSSNKSLFLMKYEEPDSFDCEQNNLDDVPEDTQCEKGSKTLFNLNYKNWHEDGDPVLDFLIGKRYVVKTDISQCFASIYTHSIPWCVVGKDEAKNQKKDNKRWYNAIDKACQFMRNGETHGLMIGPHTSNLLSEMILTSVDKELQTKGYSYIRNIDDYTCYTENYEEAESFLKDLNIELRKFDLLLNHKKTLISELPQLGIESWVQQINKSIITLNQKTVDLSTVRTYLNNAIEVMQTNGNNASVLFYAIKILGKKELTALAEDFCLTQICHLAIIYPYLIPIMDKYVFTAFKASKDTIEKFTEALYKDAKKKGNWEAISYALFFAWKYDFKLPEVKKKEIIESSDCICKLLLFIYCKQFKDRPTMGLLRKKAKSLMNTYFDENWVFIYETLSADEIDKGWLIPQDLSKKEAQKIEAQKKEWMELKKSRVEFLDLSCKS